MAFAAQGNAHDQYYFARREEMIAGAVAPARMDLRNEEMVRAHLYSTWLATASVDLGGGMADVLDLTDPALPIAPERTAGLRGAGRERCIREAIERGRTIVARAPDILDAEWFTAHWVEETLRSAPDQFARAFDRWRELYRATVALRDDARLQMDDPHAARREREEAERREAEARREIGLLLNRTNRLDESDFYPYRYLAGEGFLPGYNFPRLPVRTAVTVGNGVQIIDRPRFLGLTEFAPQGQVYHEGRKHRIHASVLPPSGIEGRLTRARLCRTCGYAHDAADVERCEHCGTRLDGDTSDFPQRLLDQPMMRARLAQRISSEEEERVRSGHHVTTHFDLVEGRDRSVSVRSASGEHVLEARYAPAARLWRINHGWRHGDRTGFTIDPQTGRWGGRGADDDPDAAPEVLGLLTGGEDLRPQRPEHPPARPPMARCVGGVPALAAARRQAGRPDRLSGGRAGGWRGAHRGG